MCPSLALVSDPRTCVTTSKAFSSSAHAFTETSWSAATCELFVLAASDTRHENGCYQSNALHERRTGCHHSRSLHCGRPGGNVCGGTGDSVIDSPLVVDSCCRSHLRLLRSICALHAFDRQPCLAVWAKPPKITTLAHVGQSLPRELPSRVRSMTSAITSPEHDTLAASTDVKILADVQCQRPLWHCITCSHE